ncbi:MAG TPA: hypothetical protein VGB43_06300 [Flavobacterium sp.]|jgi:hypothetical protein
MPDDISSANAQSSLASDSSDNGSNESVDVGSDSSVDSADLSASELQDLANDPNLSKAEKKEVKKMLKELEIKYNGKTEKVQLPFEIEEQHAEYMRRQLQMSKMGQSKAQEAANWERDTMAFLNDLKQNPRKVLSNPHLGVDLKKIAAEIIEEEIANAQKSPEEIEREEYKKKLKEYEEKEEKRNKEIEEMKRQKIIDDAYAQYDMSMTQAMEKYDIPKSPLALWEMAHLMSLEIKRGFEPDMDAIAQLVEEKMNSGYGEHVKKLSPDKLKKILGEEIFENERKARVAKVKKSPVPVKTAVKDVAKTEKKEEVVVKKKTFGEQWGI